MRANINGLNTGSAAGVVVERNSAATSSGMEGVFVMEGVLVIVGVCVIVGVREIVGVSVMVGVAVIVGEGGNTW